MTKFLKITKNY
uniref:Uncharacterized protein n=1 Tax=Anguilla anguilla TaxID=7936 RepID=A0A0E9VE28_ANGAN